MKEKDHLKQLEYQRGLTLMVRNFFYILFFYLIFVAKSFSSDFIGVIGVAVGDIYNQKNEKLLNGSKIFYGDTILANSKSNAQILFLDEFLISFL